MTRLRTLGPTVKPTSTAIAKVPPKTTDSFYRTEDWKHLRLATLKRAGYRCEIKGPTCTGRATIADHIVSRKNGGTDTMSNLRAACRACDNRLKEDHTGRRRSSG